MKKFLILIPLALAASGSQAKTLLTSFYGPGWCPDYCESNEVAVEENGDVYLISNTWEEETSNDVNTVKTLVGKLADPVILNIKKKITLLGDGELVDFDEGMPFCEDGATVSYYAFKGSEKIRFGKDDACHRFRDRQAGTLAEILRGFFIIGAT